MIRRTGFRVLSFALALCLLLPGFSVSADGAGVFEPYLVKGYSDSFRFPERFTSAGRGMFFTVDDGVSSSNLWWTDGTLAGTVALNSNPDVWFRNLSALLAASGVKAFAIGSDPVHGDELWVSDGTVTGTHLIKDIYPGAVGSDILGGEIAENRMFFSADHPEYGRELWVSDGTATGTHMVKDMLSDGNGASLIRSIIPFGANLVFSFDNEHTDQNTLWLSNGTSEGTTQIGYFYMAGPGIEANGKVYFVGQKTQYDWTLLYQTDGTSAGTMRATDTDPNADPDNLTFVHYIYHVGNKLLMIDLISEEGIYVLWAYDLQARTLVKLKTITGVVYPYTRILECFSSNTRLACAVQDSDGSPGFQTFGDTYLWMSDGTAAGTQRVTGSFSNPQQLLLRGSKLAFIADTLSGDQQIWETDGVMSEAYQLTNLTKTICLFESEGETYPSGFQYAG